MPTGCHWHFCGFFMICFGAQAIRVADAAAATGAVAGGGDGRTTQRRDAARKPSSDPGLASRLHHGLGWLGGLLLGPRAVHTEKLKQKVFFFLPCAN